MAHSPEGMWQWRKSTHCASNSCVEVAILGGRVALRDSKTANSPALVFSQDEWIEFIKGARNGEFNPNSIAGGTENIPSRP